MGATEFRKRDVRLVRDKMDEVSKRIDNLLKLTTDRNPGRHLALVATNIEIAGMFLRQVEEDNEVQE